MPRNFLWALTIALVGLAAAGPTVAADRGDRLDRFRELAASRLGLSQILTTESPAEAYREIYALLDDEIVESLASGGPFASLAFLQDRLDTFADAWGGATLHMMRAGDVMIGAFVLDERSAGNSVRVYGRVPGDGAAMLRALYREGRPTIYTLPGSREAVIVTWEGMASGWGTRPLRVELLRRQGDQVQIVWSTAELFTDGLQARSWSVQGRDVRIRYQVRYPGWSPGCEDQTEQEDVYRLAVGAPIVRVSRTEHEAWHRDLHATVERLLAAVAARDETTLSALVPDRAVRSRLPAALRDEPACDGREAATGDVRVAAEAEGQPWTLTFRRQGGRWRLMAASRVLQ
jgi:hypothetical protein